MISTPLSKPLPKPIGRLHPLLADPALELLYIPNGYSGSGNIIQDFSGKGRHGTLAGPLWRGGCLIFDGDDEATVSLDLSDIKTISVFSLVKPTGSGFRGIASHGESLNPFWAIYINNGGIVTSELQGDTGLNSRNSSSSLINGQLHTVCNVFDLSGALGTEIPKIYIDGANATGAFSGGHDNGGTFMNSTFKLGNYISDLFWSGCIYFHGVFSRILRADEVVVLDNIARGIMK